MKIALMADSLLGHGGAEKTFAVMCRAFPEADVYTTVYDPALSPQELRAARVRELVRGQKFQTYDGLRRNFPAAIAQLQAFSFRDYDILLTSAAHLARFVRPGNARHISYTYYPFRLLYEPDLYPQVRGANRALLRVLSPLLRAWDRSKAHQVHEFISISRLSRDAILRYYGADSTIIPSPIFSMPDAPHRGGRQDYFLLVSRLEPWKRLDAVFEAFSGLKERLVVVGDGPERARLQGIAGPNVAFVGSITEAELARRYRECRALVHNSATEYGLTPLEANAHGAPVICLGVAGVLDTMVPYHENPFEATALFYPDPTAEAIRAAIGAFAAISIRPESCFRNAQRFSADAFIRRLRSVVAGGIGPKELAAGMAS